MNAHNILLLFALFLLVACKDVYITQNGMDTSDCGAPHKGCATFSYVLYNRVHTGDRILLATRNSSFLDTKFKFDLDVLAAPDLDYRPILYGHHFFVQDSARVTIQGIELRSEIFLEGSSNFLVRDALLKSRYNFVVQIETNGTARFEKCIIYNTDIINNIIAIGNRVRNVTFVDSHIGRPDHVQLEFPTPETAPESTTPFTLTSPSDDALSRPLLTFEHCVFTRALPPFPHTPTFFPGFVIDKLTRPQFAFRRCRFEHIWSSAMMIEARPLFQFAQSCDVSFERCTFSHVEAMDGPTILFAQGAQARITGSHFLDVRGSHGYGVLALFNHSSLALAYSIFTRCGASNQTEDRKFDTRGGVLYSTWTEPQDNSNAPCGDPERMNRVTVDKCRFVECVSGAGGALYLEGTEVSITDSHFTLTAAGDAGPGGGAVMMRDCKATVSQCYFSQCFAHRGGAIAVESSCTLYTPTTHIEHTYFHSNMARGSAHAGGGAIAFSTTRPGRITVHNCTFTSNSAFHWGGAIAINDNKRPIMASSVHVAVTECDFFNNWLASNQISLGGGISVMRAVLFLEHCTLLGNRGSKFEGVGGGVCVWQGSLTVHESVFSKNVASQEIGDGTGGAIYGGYVETINITRSLFLSNRGCLKSGNGVGGAISLRVDKNAAIDITDCSFIRNTATKAHLQFGTGGALSVIGFKHLRAVMRLAHCQFHLNAASYHGPGDAGALFLHGVELYSDDNIFAHNYAASKGMEFQGKGGAILAVRSRMVSVRDTVFTRNSGSLEGSGEGGALSVAHVNASLVRVTMAHNSASAADDQWGRGGGISALDSQMEIIDSFFEHNAASFSSGNGDGGAIKSFTTALQIRNSRFISNIAARNTTGIGRGGAIYSSLSVPLHLERCFFFNNSASESGPGFGGAMSTCRTHLVLYDTVFQDNFATHDVSASGHAGALFSHHNPSVLLINVIFRGNIASVRGIGRGGAVLLERSERVNMLMCLFQINVATRDGNEVGLGGALYALDSALTLVSTTFNGNSAATTHRFGLYGSGGALMLNGGVTTIDSCGFTNNSLVLGGGAAIMGIGTRDRSERGQHSCLQVINSEFRNNVITRAHSTTYTKLSETSTMATGASIALLEWGDFAAHNTRFEGSSGSTDGGAIWLFDIKLKVVISKCNFHGNKAALSGGALTIQATQQVILDNVFFSKNEALYGGALAIRSTKATMHRIAFMDNRASVHRGPLLPLLLRPHGGAILADYSAGPVVLSLNKTVFMGNLGGGISIRDLDPFRDAPGVQEVAFVNMTSTTMRNNTAMSNSSVNVFAGPHAVVYADEETAKDVYYPCVVNPAIASRWVLCRPGSVARILHWATKEDKGSFCHVPQPRVTLIEKPQTTPAIVSVKFKSDSFLPIDPECELMCDGHPSLCRKEIPHRADDLENGYVCTFGALRSDTLPVSFRISSDSVQFGEAVHWKINDPSKITMGFLIAAVICALTAALVFAIMCLCWRRFQALRKATRIELQSWKDLKITEVDFSKLRILERIGNGAKGEVFRGQLHGTEVAVKRPFDQMRSDGAIDEFLHEVAVMKNLRHPNVVLMIGATTRSPLLIISEYVQRGSLYEILHDSNIRLTWRRRIKMCIHAARGMLYLHSLSPPLLHRDLKTPNLLVDKEFVVKVSDFGLTRLQDDSHTMTAAGTPAWTAPEVIQRRRSHLAIDVYAFGIIMWEFATRRPPYEGMNPIDVALYVAQYGCPLYPPENCPAEFGRLMRECVEYAPDDRPTFAQVFTRLDTLLPTLPLALLREAPPPTEFPTQPDMAEREMAPAQTMATYTPPSGPSPAPSVVHGGPTPPLTQHSGAAPGSGSSGMPECVATLSSLEELKHRVESRCHPSATWGSESWRDVAPLEQHAQAQEVQQARSINGDGGNDLRAPLLGNEQ